MARLLRLQTISAVALCPVGANLDRATGEGAHVTLFKHREDGTPMADTSTYTQIEKNARQHYPALSTANAVTRYCTEHADGRALYERHCGRPAPPTPAVPLLKATDATAAIARRVAIVTAAGIATADAWLLVAKMFPHLYATHAGHASMVAKSAPTAESLLAELAAYYAEAQAGLRRVADQHAAELTAAERRELVTALLNAASS